MEYLTYLYFGILYVSGWVAFRVYRMHVFQHSFKFKEKDLLFYSLCGYLFVMPIFLLFKNFTFGESLINHLTGLLLGGVVAEYIVSQHFGGLNWGLIIIFMGIGFLSTFLLQSYRWKDGEYCAYVHYYNPNSGNESDYQLKVEIEEGRVIKIKFPEGGWLDEDHFEPEPLKNGEVTIVDDRDYEYTVSHLEKGKCE